MNAYFIGIGGMGMSALAKMLHESGFKVAGSDRNLKSDYCERLKKLGIKLYLQNGEGIKQFMNENSFCASDFKVVKSTAVESSVPDVVAAEELGVEQIMRSDLLASMFNKKHGIAIGGTAGKTTTTGLIAWIFSHANLSPSCAVGGIMSGLDTNALSGAGSDFIIEADESDGSIIKYKPAISVVTNITKDHKTIGELKELFAAFLDNTSDFRLVCGDDIEAAGLKSVCSRPITTYGFGKSNDWRAENISVSPTGSAFSVCGFEYKINLPGEHNVLNALAAIAVSISCGLSHRVISEALLAFPGMKRRFEKIGSAKGITIIDDFAHNPAEIAAAVSAARKSSERRFIVYQPHGFGPTGFTRDELVEVFCSLNQNEFLFLDDIYYGGGTVKKDISSKELAEAIKQSFKNVWHISDRSALVERISSEARPGDMVLVMGARDINAICSQILSRLEKVAN